MAAPKPCLGYPSRTAAVVALREQGLTTQEIADKVGIERQHVSALEQSAARYKTRRGAPPLSAKGALLIPPHLILALAPHALRRCMTATTLAHRIIEAVVADNIIDAVLDDSEERAA